MIKKDKLHKLPPGLIFLHDVTKSRGMGNRMGRVENITAGGSMADMLTTAVHKGSRFKDSRVYL